MKELLEAGVHFGHQTKRWNPKMKEYIFGQRNGIYIVDLQKTIKIFKEALQFTREVVESGKEVLMVGTKKQAQDIIKELALKCESYFVNQRWLGGLLTNFNVIRGSVDRLIEFDEMKDDGRWELLSKKDQSKLEKVYRKLSKNLGGIKEMIELPGLLFVIDSAKEEIAISEAQKMQIPIVAVVDTNGDPENIEYPIPGNDDAVRAIELFTSKISEAIIEAKKNRLQAELQEEKKEEEAISVSEEARASERSSEEGEKEKEEEKPEEAASDKIEENKEK
jgi:small subunit ribosomal protein S2